MKKGLSMAREQSFPKRKEPSFSPRPHRHLSEKWCLPFFFQNKRLTEIELLCCTDRFEGLLARHSAKKWNNTLRDNCSSF